MNTRQDKFVLWFSALAFVLACIPSTGVPVPTVDPDQINQFIAQTANAAKTKTANALPTSTSTTTITPTPGNTFTPSATFTATVIFQLDTPTSPATATIWIGGGGSSEDDFACEVLSVNPVNGASFWGGSSFDVTWKVKNIGQRKWNEGAVDLVFESGTRMHTVASYELESDISPGDTVNLVVEMEAPISSGNHTTTWVLRRGNNSFCELPFNINVR